MTKTMMKWEIYNHTILLINIS